MIDATERTVLQPRNLRDALTMLRDEGPLVPLAGGTDLYVALNAGTQPARRYLDVWGLTRLRFIERDGRRLRLGALTTYSDCIRSQELARNLPILAAAAREVGGVQIQNRGTLGGNIGNGSPAGDSLPVLCAVDATVVLQSRDGGERLVPLIDFYRGYRQTVRRPDELIVEVQLKIPRRRQRFRKVGSRAAQAISKVVMASVGNRIAFGSVAPTVILLRRLESYLDGGGRDRADIERLVRAEVKPIDDIRSTAAYRAAVAVSLVEEALFS